MSILRYIFFFVLFIATVSCDKPPVEKPEGLIKRDQMINLLADIHIAQATYDRMRHDSIVSQSSSANFYHSVLQKYEVSDSLFELSFIYYVSEPKKFEKMYQDVMNKLSEQEQEYSGRKNELLQLEVPDK